MVMCVDELLLVYSRSHINLDKKGAKKEWAQPHSFFVQTKSAIAMLSESLDLWDLELPDQAQAERGQGQQECLDQQEERQELVEVVLGQDLFREEWELLLDLDREGG